MIWGYPHFRKHPHEHFFWGEALDGKIGVSSDMFSSIAGGFGKMCLDFGGKGWFVCFYMFLVPAWYKSNQQLMLLDVESVGLVLRFVFRHHVGPYTISKVNKFWTAGLHFRFLFTSHPKVQKMVNIYMYIYTYVLEPPTKIDSQLKLNGDRFKLTHQWVVVHIQGSWWIFWISRTESVVTMDSGLLVRPESSCSAAVIVYGMMGSMTHELPARASGFRNCGGDVGVCAFWTNCE